MTRGANSDDWNEYYEKTGGRPPRKTLLAALAILAAATFLFFSVVQL